jgi:hypothetical protein
MIVIILLLFIGVILLAGFIILFAYLIKNRDMDYIESMSLMPLWEDQENGNKRNNL